MKGILKSNFKTKNTRISEKFYDTRHVLDVGFKKARADRIEQRHEYNVMWNSFVIIVITSIIFFAVAFLFPRDTHQWDFFFNMGCNILALFIVVLCLDTLVNRNNDLRIKRDEARKILRHHRIISPDIDMYLVRKNLVITPAGGTFRKFKIESEFRVNDMRDMYGPSDLVSDVGISKINRFSHYQYKLRDDLEDLLESVDFMFYPEIADAVMRFLNATSYGEAALEAVLSYEHSRSGNKAVKSIVVGMIRDEPEDGSFVDADANMKNIYLVHQMICDQQKAIYDYIKLIKTLQEQNPDETKVEEEDDYE